MIEVFSPEIVTGYLAVGKEVECCGCDLGSGAGRVEGDQWCRSRAFHLRPAEPEIPAPTPEPYEPFRPEPF